MSLSWTQERARIASLSRSRNADDPELIAARQRLKAVRLEDHVRRNVRSAPLLSSEQLDRIVALLRAAGSTR